MKNKALAVFIGAFIAYFWSTISWMFLPWHNMNLRTFDNGEVVEKVLAENIKESGIYYLPNINDINHKDADAHNAWMEKAKKGPFAYISVRKEGQRFDMARSMGIQFLTQILMSILALIIIVNVKSDNLWKKAQIATIGITAGAISFQLPHWNWYSFPTGVVLAGVIDTAFTWTLATVGIATILKRAKT